VNTIISVRHGLSAFGIVACLACSGFDAPAAQGGPSTPRRLNGPAFEASGVVHVPGTSGVLFVDDGRTREVFWMELTAAGEQNGSPVPVALGADVTDLEGITVGGKHFYVVGSQSKTTGFDGDGLVRFTFDPASRRAENVERIQGLKAWLAANVPELRGADRRSGDDVLNIEAIAWDAKGARLLLGLRAPVIDGNALVIPIRLANPDGPFSPANLRIDGKAIALPLQGAGIRSLEYDDRIGAFRVITGAPLNAESREFRILEWNGAASAPFAFREIARYAAKLKPEGITRASLGGRSVTVVVFDTGQFALLD
jgi:hypothetical protein